MLDGVGNKILDLASDRAASPCFKAIFLAVLLDNMFHLREDQQLMEKTWDGERVTILA